MSLYSYPKNCHRGPRGCGRRWRRLISLATIARRSHAQSFCGAPIWSVGSLCRSRGLRLEKSELSTAITDCQLDAHREIVETKNQSEEKRKFALGEFSDACLKKKGFRPRTGRPTVLSSLRRQMMAAVSKASIECWSK